MAPAPIILFATLRGFFTMHSRPWTFLLPLLFQTLLSAAADCADQPYWSFTNLEPLGHDTLDPAIYPGRLSPHLHQFNGGNGLTKDMRHGTLLESSCTTNRIKFDKSLYWFPGLFFQNATNEFYLVPVMTKLYYKYFEGADEPIKDISEFPVGFAMIGGDTFQRSWTDGYKPDGSYVNGLNWHCTTMGAPIRGSNGTKAFPTGFTSCFLGLWVTITLPSCWNGEEFDPRRPHDHMRYPTNLTGRGLMGCPEGFRVKRFPQIVVEAQFQVNEFEGYFGEDESPWVCWPMAIQPATGFMSTL